MRYFVKSDASVINRVVYYSILLRNLRLSLLQLRFTKLAIRGLGVTVPSYKDLDTVESELMRREIEIQQSCRLLLEPLFNGIDFGHTYLNHWAVSMIDIRRGYCELEEILQYGANNIPKRFGRKFVLLLDDYTDPTLGNFRSGDLIGIATAVHFIDKIPEKENKVKGLYDAIINNINLAIRYRKSII